MDLSLRLAPSGNQSSNKEKGTFSRHSAAQRFRLEEIFQTVKYPTHKQKNEIAKELDLEPKQVNWWFTYKRAQVKNASQKDVNAALRAEIEMLSEGKMETMEKQKNVFCQACRDSHLKQLRLENELLVAPSVASVCSCWVFYGELWFVLVAASVAFYQL